MSVFMVIDVKIKDRETYEKYVKKVKPLVESYGGRYIVRGGGITPIAGGWEPERIIIIEFENSEGFRNCFSSPEYNKITGLRESSTLSRTILVEGVP